MQGERFKMPEPESILQGHKTIIRNFGQVMKDLRREPQHVMKYFTKDLATPVTMEGNRLILNSKFTRQQLSKSLENYAKQYVLCSECGKPDTHFETQQGIRVLRCQACGAVKAVKKV